MSQAQIEPTPLTLDVSLEAEWRYGWQYLPRQTQYGTEYDRVPLTLEQALHPQEGYQVVQSDMHQRRCAYLYNVFRARLANDYSAAVLSDVLIRWDVPGMQPDAPDIAVIKGIREQHTWESFDVASEGTRPVLVIEVTSAHSRTHDLANKTDDYYDAGVEHYVIADFAQRRNGPIRRLLGYQTSLDGYLPMQPNDHGWLWLEAAGVWLGIADDTLVCYDTNEQPIADYPEALAARDAAEARAAVAEAQVAALEAELQRLRGEN